MKKILFMKGQGVDNSYRLFYPQENKWGGSISLSKNPDIRVQQIAYFKGDHDIDIDEHSYISGDVLFEGDLELVNTEINNRTNDLPVKITGQFRNSVYTRDISNDEVMPIINRKKYYADKKYTYLNGYFQNTTIDDHSNTIDDRLAFTETPKEGVTNRIDHCHVTDSYFRMSSQGTDISACLLRGIKSYGKVQLYDCELDWHGMSQLYQDSRIIVVDSSLNNFVADATLLQRPLSFVDCNLHDKKITFGEDEPSVFYKDKATDYGVPYLNSLMNEIKDEYGIENDSNPKVDQDDLGISY